MIQEYKIIREYRVMFLEYRPNIMIIPKAKLLDFDEGRHRATLETSRRHD